MEKASHFGSINAAAADLTAIISDKLVAQIEIVKQGTIVEFGGKKAFIGSIGTGGSPGASGVDQYGRAKIFLLDPASNAGKLPGEVTSDGKPLQFETSDILAHELGHMRPIGDWLMGHRKELRSLSKMTLVGSETQIRRPALVTEPETTFESILSESRRGGGHGD